MASSPDSLVAEPRAARRSAQRGRLRLETQERLLGVVLIVPAFLLFATLIIYPLIYGTSLAFFSVQSLTMATRWAGLDNFTRILVDGSEFYRALWIGLQWTFGTMILQVSLGVSVALLMNQQFYGQSIARGLALFPYLVPIVVAVMVWKWMFNDVYGVLNYLLISSGLAKGPIVWLADSRMALVSVILVGTWRQFPFVVIAVLARLQTIPLQLYDAAKTDGASNWAMFWDITMPQLRGVLLITVFLRFIFDFNDFNIIGLLTGGGPASSTQTLPILIFQQAFTQQRLGLAAATADLSLLVLMVFFVLYSRAARAEERL
jgi:multiple sugar transport system permease protein